MHDQHGAPSSVMNPMTPKLAVAATLTRWRHPPLKSSEKRSWATEGDMKKKTLKLHLWAPEFGF